MRNRGQGAAGPHRPAYRAAAVHLPGVDRKGRAGTCGKYKGLRVMHHCFALQGFSSTTPCPKPLLASGCAPGIIGSDPRTQSHPPLMENNCSFIMAVNGERGNNHSEWSHLLGKSRAGSPADTSVQGCMSTQHLLLGWEHFNQEMGELRIMNPTLWSGLSDE